MLIFNSIILDMNIIIHISYFIFYISCRIFYILYSIFYILYFMFCILYFIFYILYFIFFSQYYTSHIVYFFFTVHKLCFMLPSFLPSYLICSCTFYLQAGYSCSSCAVLFGWIVQKNWKSVRS